MGMNFQRKIPIPQEVKKEYALTEKMVQVKADRDKEIRQVFEGTLDKFILIIATNCLYLHVKQQKLLISIMNISNCKTQGGGILCR